MTPLSACRCRSSRASSSTARRAPASSWSAPSATRPTCAGGATHRLAAAPARRAATGALAAVDFGERRLREPRRRAANRAYAELAGKTVSQARDGGRRAAARSGRERERHRRGAPLGEPRADRAHRSSSTRRASGRSSSCRRASGSCACSTRRRQLLAKGDADRVAPRPSWARATRLDRESPARLVRQPPALLRRADPGLVSARRRRRARLRAPDRRRARRSCRSTRRRDVPPGYDASQRDQPGGFVADPDVFDTWFTSSLTPQIGSHWGLDAARHAQLFPADVRPQSHEIIRTWAFYTIAKALLHEDSVPWRHAAISGWILDPDRKKMSKSKGNVVTPMPLLDQLHRRCACATGSASARLGSRHRRRREGLQGRQAARDQALQRRQVRARAGGEVHPIAVELDRAFVGRAARAGRARDGVVRRASTTPQALADTESFFWTRFTDTYLELAKLRARGERRTRRRARLGGGGAAPRRSTCCCACSRRSCPTSCEEVWWWSFAAETGQPTIHRAPWPGEADFRGVAAPRGTRAAFERRDRRAGARSTRRRPTARVSMGREVASLDDRRRTPKTLAGSRPCSPTCSAPRAAGRTPCASARRSRMARS